MNDILIITGIVVALAFALMGWMFLKLRRRGLKPASRAKVAAAWKHALSIPDPVRRVMEADKVLDLALSELGFSGHLGDKLKKAGARFSDLDGVWRAHKLRNTLAHETGARASDAQAAAALRAFEKAIGDLS